MSAMSASPVKPPVLPPAGVNVVPPVASSPPKVNMMPMPANLTLAPNMNHAMPLSLIADHKMSPQFPTQSQTGIPPVSQPLMRTPEKPKEPYGPTSNGMENLPTSASTLPETQLIATAPVFPKMDLPAATEIPDAKPTLPENASEQLAATASQSVNNEHERKEEVTALKPVESVSDGVKVASVPPVPAPLPEPVVSTPLTPASATEQPTVTPSVSRTEQSVPHNKPELKVATIPRQATKRKREPKVTPPSPEVKKEGKEDERKSKRVRLPTQPYQSPLPELNIIAKISKSSKSTPTKAADDKLIVFYKNEFLAVRNAEGGFYVCQAMQNIYKSSPRIRIRWLSQEDGKDTYSPDFYDHTDFDCILTNLNLDKVEKEKYRLPAVEQQRTESILKRALDVEKGVSEKPPVTEEHPDGLDLSLFRDESQLKKSSKGRRKKSDSTKSEGDADSSGEEKDEEYSEDDDEEEINDEEEKSSKTESASKSGRKKKKSAKKKPPVDKKSASKSASNSDNSSVLSAKKKNETRVASKRKTSVSSTNSQTPEKRSRSSTQPSDRTNKTKSAEEETGAAKSQRERRVKSRK